MESYKTVKFEASNMIYERRSKFIGHIKPIKSETEAIEFINSVKAENYNSKHNAYAYVLKNKQIVKCSDDGEPTGSAGKQILNVINKAEIENVVIVVTRYFGGILLGMGGLSRAYSKAAKMVLKEENIVTMRLYTELKITLNYGSYGKIVSIVTLNEGRLKNEEFLNDIIVNVYIEKSHLENLKKELIEATSGKITIQVVGESFLYFD